MIPTLNKRIVIGENMRRVRAAAKMLGARYYQAWVIEPFDSDLAMRRNQNWIKRKMAEGYAIYDIGIDPDRVFRSRYYEMEKDRLASAGYAVIRLY